MKPSRFLGTALLLSILGGATPALAQGGRDRDQTKPGPKAQPHAQRTQQPRNPRQRTQQQPRTQQPRNQRPQAHPRTQQPRVQTQPGLLGRGGQRPAQPAQRPSRPQVGRRQPQRPQTQRPAQPQIRSRPAQRTRPAARPQVQVTPQRQQIWRQRQQNNWRRLRAQRFDTQRRSWRARGGYRGYRIPTSYFSYYYGPSRFFRLYGLPFELIGAVPRFQYGGYWFSLMDPYPEYWGNDWYRDDDVYVDYVDDGYYLFNRSYPNRPGIALSISL